MEFRHWLIIGEGTNRSRGAAPPKCDGARFNPTKHFVLIGATLGFLVWFFGFMVVGGEWFQMWQSQKWNGQEGAFRFYLTILAVLIFVSQEDGNLRKGS